MFSISFFGSLNWIIFDWEKIKTGMDRKLTNNGIIQGAGKLG